MKLTVKLPMLIYTDNQGAIDLINRWNIQGGTKHIDVRLHFVRELKEKNKIRVEKVHTSKNPADMFTKNLDRETFVKHRNHIYEIADESKSEMRKSVSWEDRNMSESCELKNNNGEITCKHLPTSTEDDELGGVILIGEKVGKDWEVLNEMTESCEIEVKK